MNEEYQGNLDDKFKSVRAGASLSYNCEKTFDKSFNEDFKIKYFKK